MPCVIEFPHDFTQQIRREPSASRGSRYR